MSFGQPLWLWAFAALPLMIALFFRNEWRRRQLVQKIVAARLEERLAGTVSVLKRRWRFVLLLLGFSCVVLALAQPRLGYAWEQSRRKGRDILIAIDVSKSMLATDLTPTRLGRAKLAAQDLIAELAGDRVGLIAFAGGSFLQAPLTVDYSAVINALQELDTEIIPRGGTNIAGAIRAARDAFGKGESEHRALVIFTDGEELEEDGIEAAEKARDVMRIFTIGVGSNDGSLIPLPQGERSDFVKDPQGQIVKSRLDEDRLTRIAEATGGFYVRFVGGRAELDRVVHEGLGKMSEQDIDARLSRQPIERYQWPLALGLTLVSASLLIGERRRIQFRARALALLVLLATTAAGSAKNRALDAYERRDYDGALQQFSEQLKDRPRSRELQFNVGDAAYQKGEFEKALDAFSKALTSPDPRLRGKAAYNLGNTLFQRGVAQKRRESKLQDWRNALQHYAEALKVDPKNENAAYNAEIVRKLMEEAEKEPPPQEKEDDQKQEKNDGQSGDQKQQQGGKGDKDQNDSQQSDKQNQQKDGKDGDKQEQNKGGKKNSRDAQKGSGQKGGEQKAEGQKGDEQKEGEEGGKPDEQGNGNEKKQGDLRNAPQFDETKEGEGDTERAAEALAAAEGKMTETQARSLLESLKGEDDRVQLLNPKDRKTRGRVLRDW